MLRPFDVNGNPRFEFVPIVSGSGSCITHRLDAAVHGKIGAAPDKDVVLREAEKVARDGLIIRRQLAAEFPTRPDFRQDLGVALHNMAALLGGIGQAADAEATFREAIDVRKRLAADFPKQPDYGHDLARSHADLALALQSQNRSKDADAELHHAIELVKSLAAKSPNRADYRGTLAAMQFNLAYTYDQQARFSEAASAYQEVIAIYRTLAASHPKVQSNRSHLALALVNLGSLSTRSGGKAEANAEANAAFQEALSIFRQLARESPGNPAIQNGLASTLGNLGGAALRRREFAEARTLLDEAMPHYRTALAAEPKNPGIRANYVDSLSKLARARAGLRDDAGAHQIAQAIRDFGWNASTDAYNAACALATCVPIVQGDGRAEKSGRDDVAQRFATEAVKLLREAVTKGWTDAAATRADHDLAPLAEREDFKRLLQEMEAKQPRRPSAAPNNVNSAIIR